jgi:hypothetical protein
MHETCFNCRFWKQWGPTAASPDHGDCRNHSPAIFQEALPTGGAPRLRTKFPTTHKSMWCGDHEPVLAAAPAEKV